MNTRLLKKDFYERPTLSVAQELLGKYLVRHEGHKTSAFMITEVEAYDGLIDKASHAAKGMTLRNAVMYGVPGVWYVYLVYGMHNMLNIVTREKGYPAAVLIRGVEGISGPGRLTKALTITRRENEQRATQDSGLWIEDRGIVVPAKDILRTPRIGVDYAGEYWAQKPWRFVLLTIPN